MKSLFLILIMFLLIISDTDKLKVLITTSYIKDNMSVKLILNNNNHQNYLIPLDNRSDLDILDFKEHRFMQINPSVLTVDHIELPQGQKIGHPCIESKSYYDKIDQKYRIEYNLKAKYFSKKYIINKMILIPKKKYLKINYTLKLMTYDSIFLKNIRFYHLDKSKQYYVQLRYKFDSLDAQKYLGQATIDSLERATGAKLFYGELKSNKVPLVKD